MTATPSPRPRRNSALIGALAALAVVLLAAAALTAYLLAGRDHSGAAAVAPAASTTGTAAPSRTRERTYTVAGSLTVASSYGGSPDCAGTGGYFDIKAGARMFVLDTAGHELARGVLEVGHVGDGGCVFQFAVPGVPAGHGSYQTAVQGHDGPVLTESEVARGALFNLTLA